MPGLFHSFQMTTCWLAVTPLKCMGNHVQTRASMLRTDFWIAVIDCGHRWWTLPQQLVIAQPSPLQDRAIARVHFNSERHFFCCKMARVFHWWAFGDHLFSMAVASIHCACQSRKGSGGVGVIRKGVKLGGRRNRGTPWRMGWSQLVPDPLSSFSSLPTPFFL